MFTLKEIEEALKEQKPSVMFITHGESTGGVLQPLEGMAPLCHKSVSQYISSLDIPKFVNCSGPQQSATWPHRCPKILKFEAIKG